MKFLTLVIFTLLLINFPTKAQNIAFKPKRLSEEDFIIKKDSSRIYGKVKIKIEQHRRGDTAKIVQNEQEYYLTELLAFQNISGYHTIFGENVWYTWSLGKINAYTLYNLHLGERYGQSNFGDNSTYGDCYLHKGPGGMGLLLYTTQNLYDMISDNEDAIAVFNEIFKKKNNRRVMDGFYRKLRKVLVVYNGESTTTF